MTSPAKQGSSRWGFLSQAVGGLESRLDILLAEGQEGQANKPTPAAGNTVSSTPAHLHHIYTENKSKVKNQNMNGT